MGTIDQQLANQIANIEKATGRSLADWIGVVNESGLEKHRKQFALVGPAGGQLEVCLNLPGAAPSDRLKPTTGMATHKVRIGDAGGLDDELVGWLREAYERA